MILVELVDWLSVPPVTVPVQESVPSSSSARGETVRVPVKLPSDPLMAGVTEYLSGGMWSRPLQWVETASSLFTLESSVTVHVSVRAVPANRVPDRFRETDTAGGGTEKEGRGEGRNQEMIGKEAYSVQ